MATYQYREKLLSYFSIVIVLICQTDRPGSYCSYKYVEEFSLALASLLTKTVPGLTYSVDAGQPIQPAPNGDSYEPDLKYFYPVNFQEKPPATNASEQLSAHTLGEIGTLFTVHYTSDLNDPATNLSSASYTLFDGSYWIYRFVIIL